MALSRSELTQSAFSCDGVWFEDVVPGYRTLNTKARKLIEKSLTLRDSDKADGSVLTRSKYPQREIEVEYMIEGDNWEEFQDRYQLLMEYLNRENAKIIFNGESDKYVIGSFVAASAVDEEQFSNSGTYKIVCADPFKYSVSEYVEAAVSNQWSVSYDGTYKSHPVFVFEFPKTLDSNGDNTATSECGYVGIANQNGAVLQFGDPDEKDWGDITAPATKPIDKSFSKSTSLSNWTLNGTQTLGADYSQVGTVAINTTDGYAYPNDYDSGSKYHGPAISKMTTLSGATNWKLSWKQKFIGAKKQYGDFFVLLYNNDSGTRTLMAGVEIRKTSTDTNTTLYWYANNNFTATNSKKGVSVACSKVGTSSIKKEGNVITFNVAGKSATAQLSDTNAAKEVNEVAFFFGKKGSSTALGSNFLYSCTLEKNSYVYEGNIENTFMPGTVLTVDTQNAEVYLDSGDSTTPANNIGALGNDWETFVLQPGANLIEVDYSEFTTTPPDAIMKYRKVYL